ncbi:MAG TPA: hypothetical protein VFG28_00590 [Syntrophales bacterium]|nr:hypothetical protein [Syntrophales bacterium]
MLLQRIIKRNIFFIGLVGALLLFLPGRQPVFAAEETITASSVAKFAAGILASAAVHETAHALVAAATDTPMTWKVGNYNQPLAFEEKAASNSKAVAVYSAGLIAQLICSEIILDVDSVNKNDAFVRGMMTWNILNPILYSLDYWVFRVSNQQNGNTYQGDLAGIEYNSSEGTAQAFAIGITAIAAFQGYRFLKTQDWAPDWLKAAPDNVNVLPLRSGGAMLTYELRF